MELSCITHIWAPWHRAAMQRVVTTISCSLISYDSEWMKICNQVMSDVVQLLMLSYWPKQSFYSSFSIRGSYNIITMNAINTVGFAQLSSKLFMFCPIQRWSKIGKAQFFNRSRPLNFVQIISSWFFELQVGTKITTLMQVEPLLSSPTRQMWGGHQRGRNGSLQRRPNRQR